MRKVKVTKNFLKKGTLAFGLSKSQLIMVIIGSALALATVSGIFVFGWNANIAISIAFVEIIIITGAGVYKINGMSLFRYILLLFFLSDDVRKFSNEKRELIFTNDKKKRKY